MDVDTLCSGRHSASVYHPVKVNPPKEGSGSVPRVPSWRTSLPAGEAGVTSPTMFITNRTTIGSEEVLVQWA